MEQEEISRILSDFGFSLTNFVGVGLDSYINLSDSESRKTQSAHLWLEHKI